MNCQEGLLSVQDGERGKPFNVGARPRDQTQSNMSRQCAQLYMLPLEYVMNAPHEPEVGLSHTKPTIHYGGPASG